MLVEKVPFKSERKCSSPANEQKVSNWRWVAQFVKDATLKSGHGSGSQICFVDQIPGPCLTIIKPGGEIPEYDDLKTYREASSKINLDAIFAKLEAEKSSS